MISRRALLAVLASADQAVTLPPIAAALLEQRAGRIPHVPARIVRNGWGVIANVGADAAAETYASMLAQLRTRNLRVVLFQFGQSASPQLQLLRQLMQAKALSQPSPRILALVNAYMHDHLTTWALQQDALLAFARTGMLHAIEGPNEINGRIAGVIGTHGPDDTIDRSGPDDFAANYLEWSQALGRLKRGNSQILEGVSTVAPSLVISPPATFKKLADVSSFVDAGNLHYYAGGGRQPDLSLRFNPLLGTFHNSLHWAKVTEMGGGPVWMTECGASTSNNHYALDGISQATYLANQLFDYFAAGGQRMFIYKLIDNSGKPDDAEGNYGLFHRDGSPKPVVALFAGLQDLLSLGSFDDPRNAVDTASIPRVFDPQALVVPGLIGAGADDPNCLVMPKADGSVLIAVWNEPPIDDGKGNELTPANRPITVDFGSVQRFAVHDLLDSDLQAGMNARRGRPHTGRGTDLVLRGHPLIIELMPGRR